MSKAKETLSRILSEIAIQKNPGHSDIKGKDLLVEDLKFESLDLAQVVAMMEVEHHVDPFATGAVIGAIRTVDDLYKIYEEAISK